MIRWVKLSESLNSDPAFRALSRSARGVFAQLLLAADPASGAVTIVAGMTALETVALIAWSPGDADPEHDVGAELDELTGRGHVVVDAEGARIVVPAHPARAGSGVFGSMGVSGPGSRGGKTAAERKRVSRDRRRGVDVTGSVTGVTGSVTGSVTGMSRAVTGSPVTVTKQVTGSDDDSASENTGKSEGVTESSHGVTALDKRREEKRRTNTAIVEPCSTPVSRCDESQTTAPEAAQPALALDAQGPKSTKTPREPSTANQVRQVFEHWQRVMRHPKATLDPKRRRRIENALKSHGIETCFAAIDGCAASPFHQGENAEGKRHDDVELILRDASHIERFSESAAPRVAPLVRVKRPAPLPVIPPEEMYRPEQVAAARAELAALRPLVSSEIHHAPPLEAVNG